MDKIISLDFDDCMYDLMELNINYVEYAYGLPNIDSQIESYDPNGSLSLTNRDDSRKFQSAIDRCKEKRKRDSWV